MTSTATIDQLRPGQEYPDGNINARQHYTDAEIEELAVSLLPDHDGQLRPFLVATHSSTPGLYYVFGGGRRRIAYTRLIERGDLPKSHPIEIKDFGHISVTEALSKSWADNKAVPMHPADLAATFATLAADRPVDEIAAQHGVTVRAAQQYIALGTRLSADVLADWRAGLLKREAIEVFAITDDHEAQNDALLWAKTQWQWAHNGHHEIDIRNLRQKLTNKKEPEMKRLLGFVGADAYRDAGGVVTEDFFGQGGVVKDMKLLKKLAKDKMGEIIFALDMDGWSWTEGRMKNNNTHHGYGQAKIKAEPLASEMIRQAEIEKRLAEIEDISFDAEYNDSDYIAEIDAEEESLKAELKRIEAKALLAGATKQQKVRSGVIVSVNDDGTLHYDIGLIRKADDGNPKAATSLQGQTQQQRDTTNEADQHVDTCVGEAAAELIEDHPKELFALFLASLERGNWTDPFHADEINSTYKTSAKPFDKLYAEFAQMSPTELLKRAAGHLSEGMQLDEDGSVAPIVMSIIGEDSFQKAVAKKFDPKIYFDGASKRYVLGVIAEALGEDARNEAEIAPGARLIEDAIAAVKLTGWLPPALRTSKYVAPTPLESAIAAQDAKVKAKKSAAAKKRAA